MMLFSKKLFAYSFPVWLAISLYVASKCDAGLEPLTLDNLAIPVIAALAATILLAGLTACFGYPKRWPLAATRAVMRKIAKRAIRASLSHALTRIECSGILEIDGGVALQVVAGTSNGVAEKMSFIVYEATSDQLWRRVEARNVRDFDCDCVPFDRENGEFWQTFEDRKRHNTGKPPNIYLLRDISEIYLMEEVNNLLDNRR